MLRRRRPTREIAFSFDSFLDLVANVVGIILRLILVTWVGARAWKGPPPELPPAPEIVETAPAPLPDLHDPLEPEVQKQEQELARMQKELLEQLRKWEQAKQDVGIASRSLEELTGQRRELEKEKDLFASQSNSEQNTTRTLSLSLSELQQRSRELQAELDALKRAPSAKRTLRYRTPVSKPLQSEEVFFECRGGRVTLIDVAALLDEVERDFRTQSEKLKSQWEVSAVTSPHGAFRMRYVLERQHDVFEGGPGGAAPNRNASFRYGLSGWIAEPVQPERGEPAEKALQPGSEFRRVVDRLDPQMTAVTFWVYPDSFPLYRSLRDFLHERDLVVAGRPLPDGAPIASSRHGSASRGQ
jgi:hypothetical protein